MIKNDSKVLKNGDNIFKAQVVDTYLCINTSSALSQCFWATGLSTTNSFDSYYDTPTEVIKCSRTTDASGNIFFFPATSETSYKDIYYCGDGMDCVTGFRSQQSNGCYSGDLTCFMNQFPKITCVDFTYREQDFNNNITNASFPENLETLYLHDRGIAGDVTTVKNFNKIKNLTLCYTQFTGDFSGLGNDMECFQSYITPSGFQYCVNELVDNSTCLTDFGSWSSGGISMCADTLDFSDIQRFCMYGAYSAVKGDFSGWTFNTGLTSFCSTTQYVGGDITTWDLSGTEAVYFYLYNYNPYGTSVSGDMSTWSLPSTLRYMCLYGIGDVTCLPEDFTNTCLTNFGIYQACSLTNDINDIDFGDNLTNLSLTYSTMSGNLDDFDFQSVSGVTAYYFSQSDFTGTLSGITINDNTTILDLDGNDICGDVTDFTIPPLMYRFGVSQNTGVTMNLTASSTFDSNNLTYFCADGISGITGSFNYFTTGADLRRFSATSTPISASLNDFDLNGITCFLLYNNSISEDVTSFLTDAAGICYLCLAQNNNLSGDTSGLDFTDTRVLVAGGTAISGDMCHFNPYCMCLGYSDINSNIETDFDFSVRGYRIYLNNTCVSGHLSGITNNFNCTYYFCVNSNSDVYGSNEYTEYIFVNRKNWNRNQSFFNYSAIGDTVTGTSEQLGDLGTYGGDPSGMDLTEAEINNLAAGTDYDGLGTNTPWDGKNKVWWVENACVSSSSTTSRYCYIRIQYSG